MIPETQEHYVTTLLFLELCHKLYQPPLIERGMLLWPFMQYLGDILNKTNFKICLIHMKIYFFLILLVVVNKGS